jgi:uncharacterized membrane protein YtjA (UPF0391 family)
MYLSSLSRSIDLGYVHLLQSSLYYMLKICSKAIRKEVKMDLLGWAIIALIIAVVAGALGFTGVARGAATISRVLFGLFLVIAVVLFLMLALGISLFS